MLDEVAGTVVDVVLVDVVLVDVVDVAELLEVVVGQGMVDVVLDEDVDVEVDDVLVGEHGAVVVEEVDVVLPSPV